MASIEDVIIEKFDEEKELIWYDDDYFSMGYNNGLEAGKNIALELLKEQDRSKHGHWIVLTDCSNAGVYCSECNTKMFDRYPMPKKKSQYCGHCGSHNDLNVERR